MIDNHLQFSFVVTGTKGDSARAIGEFEALLLAALTIRARGYFQVAHVVTAIESPSSDAEAVS